MAVFAGPTGGYLLSFVPAAALVGFLCERGWDRSIRQALITFILGHLVIFACGVGWLSVLIGSELAISAGLVPFLPGMAVKTLIATALLPVLWNLRSVNKPGEG